MPDLIHQQYQNGVPLLVAVDSIIFGVDGNQLKLLVFKREVEPLAGQWSLLGSFVSKEESVNEAAQRVLEELTGLKNLFMQQLHCFGDIDRDPGDRVISIAYWSLIRVDQQDRTFTFKNHEAMWVAADDFPSLILDHSRMVKMAIENLQEKARFHPVGFELLPKKFSIPQLIKVYEAIFFQKIDDRNFRKKIINSGLLKQLSEKDMTTSKKGSFLYEFNAEMYQKMQKEGYNFQFNF